MYRLTDLLTEDELNCVMKLFIECKSAKENFRQRCAEEVVEPIISRVNQDAGYNANPASLAYCLEMYLRAVRGEEIVTSRKSKNKAFCFTKMATGKRRAEYHA